MLSVRATTALCSLESPHDYVNISSSSIKSLEVKDGTQSVSPA